MAVPAPMVAHDPATAARRTPPGPGFDFARLAIGRPLDADTRRFAERGFGQDLGAVRVHADPAAAASARTLGASAYTLGSDIVFGSGQYQPGTARGRRLLAHELSHVVQQSGAASEPMGRSTMGETPMPPPRRWPGGDGERGDLEHSADDGARRVLSGETGVGATLPRAPLQINRSPDPGAAPPKAAPAQADPPKQPADEHADKSWKVPGTQLTVIGEEPAAPGEAIEVFDFRLPFKRARVTNALDVRALPDLPQTWGSVPDFVAGVGRVAPEHARHTFPRFELRLTRDRQTVALLDTVPLHLDPPSVQGTALGGPIEADLLRNDALIDPSLTIAPPLFAPPGTAPQVSASTRLSLRDDYPRGRVDPTEIDLSAHTVPLDRIRPRLAGDRLVVDPFASGTASVFGAARAHFRVSAHYDLDRLAAALDPLGLDTAQRRRLAEHLQTTIDDVLQRRLGSLSFADLSPVLGDVESGSLRDDIFKALRSELPAGTDDEDVYRAARNLTAEILRPGFTATGKVRLELDKLDASATLGSFSLDAPTTRSLRPPLAGSPLPFKFPYALSTLGPTLIPGVGTDPSTPGVGVTLAKYGETRGASFSAAGRPYLSPPAGGIFGLIELKGVQRLGGFDVTLDGALRGQQPLFGAQSAGAPGLATDIDALHQADDDRAARVAGEQAQYTDQRPTTPTLPEEILPYPTAAREAIVTLSVTKKF